MTTNNIKHAPGPWRRGEYEQIIDATGRIISVAHGVSVPSGPGHPLWDEAEANARLIAAAPDFLALLEEVVDHVGVVKVGLGLAPNGLPVTGDMRQRVREAIAKATKEA